MGSKQSKQVYQLDIGELFQLTDTNNNGRIDYLEFQTMVENKYPDTPASIMTELKSMFFVDQKMEIEAESFKKMVNGGFAKTSILDKIKDIFKF